MKAPSTGPSCRVLPRTRSSMSPYISPNRYGLGFSPQKKGGPWWLDGWAAATGLGSRWAPFMFPFWAPGSDGWAAATGLGFRWAPFMFPFSAPGSDGWEAAEKLGSHWAPFILPFWVAGSDGWPAPLGWPRIGIPSYFLSGLLGRMGGPRQEAGPSCFLLSGSWVGWGGPRQRSWARIGLPSYFLSGLLGRMGGPRPGSWARIGLPS